MEGFEEALHNLQTAPAIVAVSDTSEGVMDMNNTPRTRRIKTVFLAMRHALDDMEARQGCFDTLRELFRQFMSVVRQRRKWFSTKYYASVMNLKEFFADNLGRSFCGIIANAFNDRSFRASLIK